MRPLTALIVDPVGTWVRASTLSKTITLIIIAVVMVMLVYTIIRGMSLRR